METPDLFFPELSPIENNLLEKNYLVDEGEPILVIFLDIGDGRKDEIRVYENDNSDQLALDFCYKHKLGARAKILLADEIERYLKVALSRSIALLTSEEKPNPSLGKSPPVRNGRNQTFTQRSMQVKQAMVKTRQNLSPEKPSISLYEPIIRRLSPSKPTAALSSVHNSPNPVKRANRRNQSMYETNDSMKNSNSLFSNKSVWVADSSNSSVHQILSKPESKPKDKSERIMKKVKYSRYKEIFNSLCPNSKGVVSPETIQRGQVSAGLKKIIAPLIEELEELDETLDFHEFYDAMEMLMKVLTPGDKSSVLLPNRASAQAKDEPKAKTKASVSMLTRNMSTSSLYERSIQRKQEITRKLAKERESLEEQQMKECKFIPTITSVHRRSFSTKSVKT